MTVSLRSRETQALLDNRAALNRMDEEELLYRAKALARSAMLFPSLVDYNAVRTVELLVKEILSHDPR